MVLQRIEGASDREAVDRFAFDLRWHPVAPRGTSPRRRPVYFGRDEAIARRPREEYTAYFERGRRRQRAGIGRKTPVS